MGSGAARADDFGWTGAVIDGRFRVDRVVGEGGFGVVYAGRHLTLDEPIAVKCLKIEGLPEDKRQRFLEGFRAEGKIMFRLSAQTTNVVRAIDLGAAISPSGAWTPYLVLEWVSGVTLEADLLARTRAQASGRSLADAISLLHPVAAALGVAHEARIAHRDLKPSNVMLARLGGRPAVKILDFGVAKVMQDASLRPGSARTGSGIRAFTMLYAAPEQLNATYGATGPWTDVYALTLLLVEVVAGYHPYRTDRSEQIVRQATDPASRPTLWRCGLRCSEEVERVLRRGLAVDARERYATAGDMWTALLAASGVSPPVDRASAPRASQPDTTPSAQPRTSTPVTVEEPPRVPSSPTKPPVSDEVPTLRKGSATPPSPQTSAPRRSRRALLVLGVVVLATFLLVLTAVVLSNTSSFLTSSSAVTSVAPPSSTIPTGPFAHIRGGDFVPGCLSSCAGRPVVTVKPFDLGRAEVTQREYREFLDAEGRRMTDGCWYRPGPAGTKLPTPDWRFPQATDEHPVVCVTQDDAIAYTRWLSRRTRRTIRLPTAVEWEYAARSGGQPNEYPWGNSWPPPDGAANIADKSILKLGLAYDPGEARPLTGYDDGWVYSSPVGRTKPNALELFDMAGNVYERLADRQGDACVVRGGSWDNGDDPSAFRNTRKQERWIPCDKPFSATGFRLARDP